MWFSKKPTYKELQVQNQVQQQELVEARERLRTQSQEVEWQKAERAKLARQLEQWKTETGREAFRRENAERELETLRALVPPLADKKSLFLQLGDNKIRVDGIKEIEKDEDGYVTRLPPFKVAFGLGPGQVHILASDLEALIMDRLQGPDQPPEE